MLHNNNDTPYRRLPNTVFVFGSNLAGRHGKGAAYTARICYGAQLGCGVGMMRRSYAIPTKDNYLNILPLDIIESYISDFVAFTNMSSAQYLHFFVTKVGTGLAGYSDRDIAPLFENAINCIFSLDWKQYLYGPADSKQNQTL